MNIKIPFAKKKVNDDAEANIDQWDKKYISWITTEEYLKSVFDDEIPILEED